MKVNLRRLRSAAATRMGVMADQSQGDFPHHHHCGNPEYDDDDSDHYIDNDESDNPRRTGVIGDQHQSDHPNYEL